MSKKDKQRALVPRLRFPEFRDDSGWPHVRLDRVAERVTTKNTDGGVTRVLTNSAEHGVLDQREYFDKDIATKGNLDGYYVVEHGDFVYNPRVSTGAPVGPLSRNNIGQGVMSPLYTVFRFGHRRTDFYEQYFLSTGWHSYLRSVSSTGARHDRMSITNPDFMRMPIPHPHEDEQEKIAECLGSLDDLIAAEGRKLEALRDHKKGLMQQLFPREGETRPRLRFPEFRDSEAWTERQVSDVFDITRGQVLAMPLVQDAKSDDAPYPVYSSRTRDQGLSGYYSEYLFEDAITWTTDGANAGDVNFRPGRFYCTNVCGVLLSQSGHANTCVAAILNTVTRNHVSYVGNPKLMNGVMAKIVIPLPERDEQDRIAEFLTSLDAWIGALEHKLDVLRSHKRGLMQQLFPSPEAAA